VEEEDEGRLTTHRGNGFVTSVSNSARRFILFSHARGTRSTLTDFRRPHNPQRGDDARVIRTKSRLFVFALLTPHLAQLGHAVWYRVTDLGFNAVVINDRAMVGSDGSVI
jgi:hypothetical protein